MPSKQGKSQAGFSLLIFLVVMMSLGGFALTGVTQNLLQQINDKKFRHNQRVLKEAKQALLQFAYNYPATNGFGPGRLPCADTNNNGIPNSCAGFGRLPWRQQNLNLYDIRDADGERLWYAVSSNFRTLHYPKRINSDSTGRISIRDQSGSLIFDGSNPGGLNKYGVAAVIIAPGSITSRNGVKQDRSVANGDEPFDLANAIDTDPGIISAVNYLDQVLGIEDNATFTQSSPTDGFILGPVNGQSADAVNDQMIIITASEVIEVAEKATLQAYRTAINNYLAPSPKGTGNIYPWLYNYAVNDLDSYPADINFVNEKGLHLNNIGRIPSIYSTYFTETDSQPIETKLSVSLSLDYPVLTNVGFNQTTPATVAGNFQFNIGANTHTINIQTANPLTNVKFEEIEPDITPNDGRLTGDIATTERFTHELYFWDDSASPTGVWTICQLGGKFLSDCNRPGPSSTIASQILHVTVELEFNTTGVEFAVDYSTPPMIAPIVAADGTGHAQISATFEGGNLISAPVSVKYEIDRYYLLGFNIQEEGTLDIADLTIGSVTLGMRYYPVLPKWTFDNNWHQSLMMAYANDYRPDLPLPADCVTSPPCIQINGLATTNNNITSILTLASEHAWNNDIGIDFSDDVGDVFDLENDDLDNIFDANALNGNDKILIIN